MSGRWYTPPFNWGAFVLLPALASIYFSSYTELSLPVLSHPNLSISGGLLVISQLFQSYGSKSLSSMRNEYSLACPDQNFSTHIFSIDPLMIYLENYISHREARYLIELAKGHYDLSAFAAGDNPEKQFDPNIRSSTSAILPEDPVVACLERRSLDFQGFLPTSHIENLQTVKYEVNDSFRPHFDWLVSSEDNPRLSTIFGYLECENCVGGSTQFPRIHGSFSEKWCKFIDCYSEEAKAAEGVGFKPIVGNALFWMQYYSNGTGHPNVLHAGMPVREGRKIGLNIMTRRYSGYS